MSDEDKAVTEIARDGTDRRCVVPVALIAQPGLKALSGRWLAWEPVKRQARELGPERRMDFWQRHFYSPFLLFCFLWQSQTTNAR